MRRSKQMRIGQEISEAQMVLAVLCQRVALRARAEMLLQAGSWADCFANNLQPALEDCMRNPDFARGYRKAIRTTTEHAPGLHRFMGAATKELLRRGVDPVDMDYLMGDQVWFAYLDAVVEAQAKRTGPLADVPEVLTKRF